MENWFENRGRLVINVEEDGTTTRFRVHPGKEPRKESLRKETPYGLPPPLDQIIRR